MAKIVNWSACRIQSSTGTVGKLHAFGTFFKEFLHSPSTVGSICPSSSALAFSLVAAAPSDKDGLMIDLGAGSGIVTEQLLKAGIPAERIIAIEKSPGFSGAFAKRCPQVPLSIGDARDLEDIIFHSQGDCRINAIISSLPLKSIPKSIVAEIMCEIQTVLQKRGGILIQYTYAIWSCHSLRRYGFKPCCSQIVMGNLPPAKIESYAV